jgi:CDP-diglyceride synthetase
MTLFILGALIAAHYVPAVQLNLKQSLLYIALPASGTSFAINLGVLLPKAKLKPIEPGRDWEGSPIYSGI